ncbi:MAG: winged helix-turn-helix transcriptional regulator [Myxococcales bacterium]|nr:winged helix-turn-helix transcriptional regulator [Myxococcales bacterium]
MTAADVRDEPDCDHEHGGGSKPRLSDPAVLERAAAIFRAVGDPARLQILERLAHGECCVSELAEESGDGMSTVSQRLKLRRAERLVIRRREGKHIFYGLADSHVSELVLSALAHADEHG